jgi:ribosomal protein S18 acetylase RimI-like enzyme
MWEISRNTVLCCMHEMYVDCPYYEQLQYMFDARLEILFTYAVSGDTRLAAQALYTSCGFEPVGERKEYYADNGEDAVIMEKQI